MPQREIVYYCIDRITGACQAIYWWLVAGGWWLVGLRFIGSSIVSVYLEPEDVLCVGVVDKDEPAAHLGSFILLLRK